MTNWKKFLVDDHADVKRLDYVIRYNSIPSLYQESVSQHTFWVVLHSVLLHRTISKNTNKQDDSIETFILRKALIHDIGECVTGDVVRTFKYANPDLKKAVDDTEDMMVEKYLPSIIKELISDSVPKNGEDAKYVDTIVKAGDFISLFNYMRREFNRGNQEIAPFLNKMRQDFMAMHEKSAKENEWYQKKISELYLNMCELATHKEEVREV